MRKNLILVFLGKLIGNGVMKLDIKLKNLFLLTIKKGFMSKTNDEVSNSLNIIGFLCQLKEVL